MIALVDDGMLDLEEGLRSGITISPATMLMIRWVKKACSELPNSK